MYLNYSFSRGNIIFIDEEYYMILSCDGLDENLIMMQLTGEYAGVTYFRTIGNIVDKIDKHYIGFSDLIKSLGDRQKEKLNMLRHTISIQKDTLSDANNIISARNDEIISLHDEIGALKDELQECYEIATFKNSEIERLQKENIKSVNKETFDKAVNDMLKNEEVSTVEEVSALIKIRALLYK